VNFVIGEIGAINQSFNISLLIRSDLSNQYADGIGYGASRW